MQIHKRLKSDLGYPLNTPDKTIITDWKKRTSDICKPCWELKYCPYGPLIEEFPLLPQTRREAIAHNEYLKRCLSTNKLDDGAPLDAKRKKWFKAEVRQFDPDEHPEDIPKIFDEASCLIFGHLCPVFMVSEPLTESKELRKHSRSIPRDVMIKVVRRDGQICQKCNNPVRDNEIEFDHIIPFSKGGQSTTDNLRLIHKKCNRKKSNSLTEILHPNPIDHYSEFKKRVKRKREA
jgi:hypothetical protein